MSAGLCCTKEKLGIANAVKESNNSPAMQIANLPLFSMLSIFLILYALQGYINVSCLFHSAKARADLVVKSLADEKRILGFLKDHS